MDTSTLSEMDERYSTYSYPYLDGFFSGSEQTRARLSGLLGSATTTGITDISAKSPSAALVEIGQDTKKFSRALLIMGLLVIVGFKFLR